MVVTVSIVVPLLVTKAGFNEQLASLIASGTVHLRLTTSVNPLVGLTVRVVVPDWPGLVMLKLAGLAVKVKSGGAVVTVTVVAVDVEPA